MKRTTTGSGESPAVEPSRLAREDRRSILLDTAAELVAAGDVDAVSVEAVAESAGVSRPLVYKHFANRHELLAALYERETNLLHRELSAAVEAAPSLEAKLRALVRGSLEAQGTRGATFAALRAAGARGNALREHQRRRDRSTVRYLGGLAAVEFGIDEHQARAGVSILLGAIESIVTQWRLRPTREHADLLEDTYVTLAMGGLSALAAATEGGGDD